MDFMTAFDISATGMNVERTRLDITALNLANANTTRGPDGGVFRPLRVIAGPQQASAFDDHLSQFLQRLPYQGVEIKSIQQIDTAPRMAYDPGHPDADEKGFVAYPGVNTATEMINLMTATRAYEANVRAIDAAKTMALKALEIGGK